MWDVLRNQDKDMFCQLQYPLAGLDLCCLSTISSFSVQQLMLHIFYIYDRLTAPHKTQHERKQIKDRFSLLCFLPCSQKLTDSKSYNFSPSVIFFQAMRGCVFRKYQLLNLDVILISGFSRSLFILAFSSPQVKRTLGQFTPARWDKDEWYPLLGPWRFIQVLSLCIVFMAVELNTFFLKFCLWIPPRNPLIVYRLVLWWLIAIPTIREYNTYLQDRYNYEVTWLRLYKIALQ